MIAHSSYILQNTTGEDIETKQMEQITDRKNPLGEFHIKESRQKMV